MCIRDSGKVVLFGGFAEQWPNVETPGDTWEWDGAQWDMKSETAAPQARMWPAMTYDVLRRQVVLFGGFTADPYITAPTVMWTWDGERWVDAAARVRPPARSHQAM